MPGSMYANKSTKKTQLQFMNPAMMNKGSLVGRKGPITKEDLVQSLLSQTNPHLNNPNSGMFAYNIQNMVPVASR